MNLPDEALAALARSVGIDAQEIARRQAFLEFDETDASLLTQMHARLQDVSRRFVDDFYAHCIKFEETRRCIPDPQSLKRLKRAQTAYFDSLSAGDYGPERILRRLRAGGVHQRIGLEPKWYIGAYSKYLIGLLPELWRLLGDSPDKFLATYRALQKSVFLDMGLAFDTYIQADRHAILGLKRYAEDIIASLPVGLLVLDQALKVQSVNLSFREISGLKNGEDISGRELEHILPLSDLHQQAQAVLASGTALHGIDVALGEKRLRLTITGIRLAAENRLLVAVEDITEYKRAEEWQQHYTQTLDLFTADAPLGEVLEGFAAFAEQQCAGASCSIQLLSPDRKHLMHGAAPSLPEFYNRAIDGLEIGEDIGSCGTAAHTARTVIIEDALTHPYWAPYRELAIRAGLRACWSEPILSADNKVLGTFSLYYREPRTPTPEELKLIRQGARLAAVVIERARQQENLRLAAVVFEQGTEAVVITDAEQRILSVNHAFTQTTGYAPEEVIGQTPRILQSGRHDAAFYRAMWESIQATGRWQGDAWERKKTGEFYPKRLSISAVRGVQGEITHYVGSSVDITEQKAHVAHIEQLAFYDPLTGLPNRTLFMDRLKQVLAVAQRHGQRVAILFMDLNRFKEINDTQGHNVGDQVLIEVARRFQATTRGEETLARLGGDEFVVIAEEADQAAATLIAKRLQQALAEPIAAKGQTFTLGVSIGIAFHPEDGATIEDLLKRADIAMYRAKAFGGGHRFYQPEMSVGLAERMQLAKNLSRALNAGNLELHYQPQVNLKTGTLIGAEALLRWNDPERGWVSPAEFISIAEERGMIGALGKWLAGKACRQMKDWQEAGLNFPGRLAVNLAAQQLEEAGIAGKLQAIVRAAGLTPACLELELTESSLMRNVEQAIVVMEALKTAGFALAIDDFGTGYSSLTYLKRLPADKLKIDMSFVRDMLQDRNDYTIVATIIGMAHSLGLKALAEGAEQAEQAETLLALGCDEAQGYYFGHPETAEIFAQKWLRTGAAPE
ncbi:hypothetical protein TPL01_06920 [Sulfuriferula plumbiphila]|uniref:Diguanylate cyclase DosC n=1 Tax=Sulfuriferula plumbiphila TaxID=171865 RepID=A0A512L511_9PROT|nr:EAL domain-containing protein [Sulfuriferula plumbiphila]BBP03267.1 hypothetical protein SFPGR_06890 [Sulfuriferula plumbiphila]GEP29554.1 hypothetical protein TPL01_06920 [Sulfuriferula plumbiphila]